MATVSDTNTETTLQLYANPLLIQDKQLSLFEQHVFDGKVVLDGNNVFTFGLEMGASLAAGIVNEMANNFQSLYPARAQTMSDLYRHLSDYDYVDMYSTPSTTTIELMFEQTFLIDNAPADEYEEGSYKIIIPEFSTFMIGNHKFGIHYPIEIRLRKAFKADGHTVDYDKCMFHCSWNTDTVNPLYRLNTNILEHRMFKKDGLSFLCVSVPIQQFSVDIKKEDTVSSTGFIKRYQYTNRFYAIRIFHYWENKWVEMAETLSDVVYDPQTLTARVKVLSDLRTVEVSIPQSYFTAGVVGNRIMCLLYTTEGALDVDIRNYSTEQFSASFLIDDTVIDDTYSAFLKRIPYLQVVPLATRISSGSNGKTFEDMKNRVMNSVGGDDLLVTPKQLEAHLADIGFKVSKYVDNITDRIYVASKEVTDSNQDVIGAGEFMTTIDYNMLDNGAYDSLVTIGPDEYVILPSAVFKYDEKTDSMKMLDRYEYKKLVKDNTTEQMISELNNGVYTFTPFHVKLTTSNDLPMAGAFDLMNPTLSNVSFTGENKQTSTQMSMYGSVLLHDANGTNGYKLTVAVYKTDDLNNVSFINGSEKNLTVLLRTTNTEGTKIYLEGTYLGKNSNNYDLVEFHFDTRYKITKADAIDVQNFIKINDNTSGPIETYLNLEQEYELLFFANNRLIFDSDAITESNNQADIPLVMTAENMVWLATQKMTIKLGESISSLRSNVFMTLTGKEYKSYSTTEYATYAADVYARYPADVEEDGIIVHHAGELIVDEQTGKLTVEKYAGDLIVTSADTSKIGASNPSCVILSTTTDNLGNKSTTNETLYLDSDHLTPTAEPVNSWYPFRTYQESNGNWRAIYTGITGSDGKINQAPIIEVKDLLKWIIDSIDNNPALMLDDSSDRYRSYTFDETTQTYSLNTPIQGNFIYAKNGEEDSVHASRYWVYIDDLGNYVLDDAIKANNTRNVYLELDLRSGSGTSHYGALYQRDEVYSEFDFSAYMTEDETCRLFLALDNLGTIDSEFANEEAIRKAFKLDITTFDKFKRFRDPWIKLIETMDTTTIENGEIDGFATIKEYWTRRSYINFNESLTLRTHRTGTNVSVSGLEALAYIQERSMNPNKIHKYESMTEGITAANTDNSYYLIWVEGYNRDNDTTIKNSDKASLINDLLINSSEGEIRGALLWGSHIEGEESHYVVTTGPSFIRCYNALMNCKTVSGYVYETTVYKPENLYTVGYSQTNTTTKVICNAQGTPIEATTELGVYQAITDHIKYKSAEVFNDIAERYIAIVPHREDGEQYTCLSFIDIAWTSNWPWEMTNWLIDKYPIISGVSMVGKPISEIGTSINLDLSNTDAKILHYAGDIQMDKDGKPTVADNSVRQVIYHVNLLHCDYKQCESDQQEYKLYEDDIRGLIRSYCDVLEHTRPMLLERTNLYFKPIKSLGYGDFKGSNGAVISMPLEISVGLRIYITAGTAGSQDSKDLIKSNIISIIEDHISSGNISCTVLSERIRQSMSDTVLYVDVLGINGNQDVQTLVSLDPSQSSVRLKSVLVLNEDNTISVEKDVNIEWTILQ